MSEPLLFVPKKKLLLPDRGDNEVVIELIAQSSPIVASFDAINILMMRQPLIPEWSGWEDGTGGNLYVTSKEGDKLPLATIDHRERLETPYSTDGFVIHENQLVLFALGVRQGSEFGVLWGALSQPLEAFQAEPDSATIYNLGLKEDEFGSFYQHAYPQ
jgi:hypothetical protein